MVKSPECPGKDITPNKHNQIFFISQSLSKAWKTGSIKHISFNHRTITVTLFYFVYVVEGDLCSDRIKQVLLLNISLNIEPFICINLYRAEALGPDLVCCSVGKLIAVSKLEIAEET